MELTYLLALGRELASRLPRFAEDDEGHRRLHGDAGQSVLEWILICGALAAIALAAVAVIATVVRTRASQVGDANFTTGG